MLGHMSDAVWVQGTKAIATAHWEAVAVPEHVARYIRVAARHAIARLVMVSCQEIVEYGLHGTAPWQQND